MHLARLQPHPKTLKYCFCIGPKNECRTNAASLSQLPHSCCITLTVAHPHSCCITLTVAHPHNCCITLTAAPQLLHHPHICPTVAASPSQLPHSCCITFTVAPQLPTLLFVDPQLLRHPHSCPTVAASPSKSPTLTVAHLHSCCITLKVAQACSRPKVLHPHSCLTGATQLLHHPHLNRIVWF